MFMSETNKPADANKVSEATFKGAFEARVIPEIEDKFEFIKYSFTMLQQRGKRAASSSDFQYDLARLDGMLHVLELSEVDSLTAFAHVLRSRMLDFRRN